MRPLPIRLATVATLASAPVRRLLDAAGDGAAEGAALVLIGHLRKLCCHPRLVGRSADGPAGGADDTASVGSELGAVTGPLLAADPLFAADPDAAVLSGKLAVLAGLLRALRAADAAERCVVVSHRARDWGSPNVMGLASLGLGWEIFCDFPYSVLLLNASLGPLEIDLSGPAPAPAAGLELHRGLGPRGQALRCPLRPWDWVLCTLLESGPSARRSSQGVAHAIGCALFTYQECTQ